MSPTVNSATDSNRIAKLIAAAFQQLPFIKYTTQNEDLQGLEKRFKRRVQQFIDIDSIVIEADDYTAVAIITKPGATYPPFNASSERDKDLLKKIRDAEQEHLGDIANYHVSFLAKDPEKSSHGAVSALIKPYLRKAKEENVPVVLLAVAEHAKEVYLHWGFRVLHSIQVGQNTVDSNGDLHPNGEGVVSYLMAYNL